MPGEEILIKIRGFLSDCLETDRVKNREFVAPHAKLKE
jgi:hypothetical protein